MIRKLIALVLVVSLLVSIGGTGVIASPGNSPVEAGQPDKHERGPPDDNKQDTQKNNTSDDKSPPDHAGAPSNQSDKSKGVAVGAALGPVLSEMKGEEISNSMPFLIFKMFPDDHPAKNNFVDNKSDKNLHENESENNNTSDEELTVNASEINETRELVESSNLTEEERSDMMDELKSINKSYQKALEIDNAEARQEILEDVEEELSELQYRLQENVSEGETEEDKSE